jgi:hypothetical protein
MIHNTPTFLLYAVGVTAGAQAAFHHFFLAEKMTLMVYKIYRNTPSFAIW